MRGNPKALAFAFLLIAGCTGVRGLQRDLASPEWEVRYSAATKLQELSLNKDTIGLLFTAMDDPAPRVRHRAARTLARLLSDSSAAAVCDRASGASDTVKRAVIEGVARAQTPEEATPFLTEMCTDPTRDIRLAAARALRGSTDAAKVEKLLGVWQHETDEEIRTAALVSASYPAESARKDKKLLSCYKDIIRRAPAMLRNPQILRAAGDLRIADAEPHLLELMTDAELRYIAIEGLGKVRSQKAVPALLELLKRDESWVMNRQVCAALGRIRAPEAARALAGYFVESNPQRDRDQWDRTLFITTAMAGIGGKEVFEAFASQITEKNRRDFALYGLHVMTGASVVRRENRWMYTWKGIQRLWREWWREHKDEVAQKLEREAEEETGQ